MKKHKGRAKDAGAYTALLRRKGATLLFMAALLSLAALLARAYPQEAAQPATADLGSDMQAGPLVVVDAGHGGGDGGSIGYAGTVEAGLNLEVARLVEKELRARGFEVLMTREDENALGDTKRKDMAERRRILNAEGAALCVSIHMNAFTDRSVRGPMAFYMEGSARGKRLAELVIANVCEAVERPLRLANPGDYFVIRECESPAVLVECGFLSNEAEEKMLGDPAYQARLARGIAAGVAAFVAEEAAQGEGIKEE